MWKAAFLGLWGLLAFAPAGQAQPQPGIAYIDVHGELRSLAYRDRVVVLGFWINNCQYSERMMSILNNIRADYPLSKVEVVGFYLDDATPGELIGIASEKGYGITVAAAQLDLMDELQSTFKFRLPGRGIFVVDPLGVIHSLDLSDLDTPNKDIDAALRRLIAKYYTPPRSEKRGKSAVREKKRV